MAEPAPRLEPGPPEGRQAGLMPRWEMEVKCEMSEPVGERMPAGRFSFESASAMALALALALGSSRDGVLLELSVRVIAAAVRLLFARGGASPLPGGRWGEGEWLFTTVGIGGLFEIGGGIR